MATSAGAGLARMIYSSAISKARPIILNLYIRWAIEAGMGKPPLSTCLRTHLRQLLMRFGAFPPKAWKGYVSGEECDVCLRLEKFRMIGVVPSRLLAASSRLGAMAARRPRYPEQSRHVCWQPQWYKYLDWSQLQL
ncbi:hypothetical protein J6590_007175 [Homalodisca vitripennis]|nr:hypothetical protein J6590_007175 [Homalodisca vitripennis]